MSFVPLIAATSACTPGGDNNNFLLPDLYKGLHNVASPGELCLNSFEAFKILLLNVLQIALAIIALVAVAMIIYAGVIYITSNGNPSNITKAKDTLINWLIGLLLVIGAYAIVGTVAGALH